MNTLKRLDHRIHLYVNADPAPRPPGTLPPLRVELLPDGSLERLMMLVAIMFSIPGLPALRWSETAAWLDTPPMLAAPVFGSATGFIAALPALEDWMSAWSNSELRQPDLAPDWAHSLTVDRQTVGEIAEAIRSKLASSVKTILRFCDATGAQHCLGIPAHASLSLPRIPVARTQECVVEEVQRVHVYMSETGTRFGVTEPASNPARAVNPSLRMPTIDIKPTRMVRVANPRLIVKNK